MKLHPQLLIVAPKAQTRKWSAMLDDKEPAVRFEDRKIELLSKLRQSLCAKKVF